MQFPNRTLLHKSCNKKQEFCSDIKMDSSVFLTWIKNGDVFCDMKKRYIQKHVEKDLKKKFPDVEHFQVTATGTKQYINKNSIIHIPAIKFLQKFV